MTRKKKGKGGGAKKRNEHIYATTTGNVTELIVTIDERTGEISFGQEMTNIYSERSYDRAKGPKVTSRIPQAGEALSFDEAPALARNFDVLCAVDTNTRVIGERRVSVVGVVLIKRNTLPTPRGLQTEWRFDAPFCMEYVDLIPPAENFGWMAAQEEMLKRGLIKTSQRVGVIVDSDLGNIKAYNERSKPVDCGELLPSHLTLIYATADADKDRVVNYALGIADAIATQVLLGQQEGRISPNAGGGHKLFAAYRCIEVSSSGAPAGAGVTLQSVHHRKRE
jgi:hypothetical protein